MFQGVRGPRKVPVDVSDLWEGRWQVSTGGTRDQGPPASWESKGT